MITTLYDAINPENIPAPAPAVAGYDDGAYVWSAAGWNLFPGIPQVHISVFADPASLAFDVEGGNASARTVAGVVAGRTSAGKPSWVYFYQDEASTVFQAFQAAQVSFLDRSLWPTPGAYIWASDPSGNIASGAWRLPVDPVAIQKTNTSTYDVSDVYVDLSMLIPDAPPDPPSTPKGKPMFVAHTPSTEYLVFDNGTKITIATPETGSALTGPSTNWPGLAYLAIDDATMAEIPDARTVAPATAVSGTGSITGSLTVS